jgi:hypothetical protein
MSYAIRFIQWQNYVHYILLTIGFIIWVGLTDNIVRIIAFKFVANALFVTLISTVNMLFALFVVDSIVHAIFWFLPKPFQWRD